MRKIERVEGKKSVKCVDNEERDNVYASMS